MILYNSSNGLRIDDSGKPLNIWLPRLDQLQNMIMWPGTITTAHIDGNRLSMVATHEDVHLYFDGLSYEELWLQLVMYIKFNKVLTLCKFGCEFVSLDSENSQIKNESTKTYTIKNLLEGKVPNDNLIGTCPICNEQNRCIEKWKNVGIGCTECLQKMEEQWKA
jgi:hypothetical protein